MAVKNFRFVSPGIFINEIDKSQLTREFPNVGPVIIGRTKHGPAMAPIQVDSFAEFQDIFGSPVPGGVGGDIWRNGNQTAPTYAAYAAQAWLRNATPLTFVRLLGTHHPDREPTGAKSLAGWEVKNAYGLFIAERSTTISNGGNAALAAVVYINDGVEIGLAGSPAASHTAGGTASVDPVINGSGSANNKYCTGQWVKSKGKDYAFTMHVGGVDETFNFNSKSEKFIRNILNTNPILLNTDITSSSNQKTYFLGETYERHLVDMLGTGGADAGAAMAVLLPLRNNGDATGFFDKSSMNIEAQAPETPWIFSQHGGPRSEHKISENTGKYSSTTNLFKLAGIGDGVWSSTNLKVTIEDIKAPENDQYGTFTVALRKTSDSDKSPVYVERFTNCNLNPNSSNYVARKIGDMESEWIYDKSKYITSGDYPNISRFIRVIMNKEIGDAKNLVPFGFYGPAVPRAVKCAALATDLAPVDIGSLTGASSVTNMAVDLGEGDSYFTSLGPTGSPALGCPSATACTQSNINLVFPAMPTRAKSTDYTLFSGTQASFGVTSNQASSVNEEQAYADVVKPYSEGFSNGSVINPGDTIDTFPALSASVYDNNSDNFFIIDASAATNIREAAGDFYNAGIVAAFTLDDLILDDISLGGGEHAKNKTSATWAPGSRFHGASISVRGSESAAWGGTVGKVQIKAQSNLSADSGNLLLKDVDRAAGSALTFTFTDSSEVYDGTRTSVTSGDVIVGLGPTSATGDGYVASLAVKLDRLVTAINSVSENTTNETTLDITATRISHDTIELVQDVVGDEGNTVVTQAGSAFTFPEGATFIGGEDLMLEDDIKEETAGISHTPDYKDVLDLGFDKFTVPLFGGFDGFDITEKEPFRNEFLDGGTETDNYAFNSIKRAINTITDPEVVEMNLAAIPGCTNSSLTSHLISVCEERGDALAIIDLEGDYVPDTENKETSKNRISNVDNAVANLKGRGINSSYGCAYFPWVQIRDASADSFLWVPPSVVALGTMASSERKSELWFAPAGFKRGGLTEGSAGLPVMQTRLKLTSKDRDKLYEANINPIASFPSEGIVIFGQKTLQVTPSALDRINVRRLLIFLKKEVSRIATGVLFDNNIPATWQRFTSKVEPFLASVKSRFGLSDFKVVLDETTTTPDLIDRNILYAKVLLKPARSIEFIAIDFVISKTGASFDD